MKISPRKNARTASKKEETNDGGEQRSAPDGGPDAMTTNTIAEALLQRLDRTLLFLDDQERRLREVLQRFLESGQGGSALLLGPPRSGKSTLLSRIIDEMEGDHPITLVVRIDGLQYASETRALKQLEALEDNCGKKKSRILVIVDHFDRFAQRSSQHLLYTVLDASRNHPIFVLGLSSRVDAVDILEKRVKSRFSNTRISFGIAIDMDRYRDATRQLLTLDHDENRSARKWNRRLQTRFLDDWSVASHLQRVFEMDSSMATLKRVLFVYLNLLRKSELTHLFDENFIALFQSAVQLIAPDTDPIEIVVKGLTLRQLCLLTIVVRQAHIKRLNEFNYKHITTVFRKFCNTNNQSKLGVAVEDEPVLYKELDKLVALGLLSIVAGGGNTAQLAFRRVCPAIERATLRECVVGFEPLPQALQFYMESEVDKD